MKLNLVALDGFVEVVKMMNHTGLWDVKLAWYYLPDLPHGLEHSLIIYAYLIVIARFKLIKHKLTN